MKYARAKRAKILFSIVKYANLWGFCCRRRRGCLSSLLTRGANRGKTNTTDNNVEVPNVVGNTTLQKEPPRRSLFQTTSAEIRLSPNALSRGKSTKREKVVCDN